MRRLLATLTAFTAVASTALADAAPARAAWVWPVAGDVITPYRNGTDPYASGQHRGIDIAAPTGAPVAAAAAGEVRFAGTAGSNGLTVSIRTGDGYDTSYLHLSALAVRAGAQVSAGERIGAVGTSGTRSASQPHLHFGVRDAGSRHAYHDPMGFLPPPAPPRAPDPPPPATSPEPAPAPPAAAPAPARAPAAAPRRAPRTTPVSHRAPRPAPVARRAPRPVLHGGRAPRPVPAGHSMPATRPATEPRQAPLPAPSGASRPVADPRTPPARAAPARELVGQRTGSTAPRAVRSQSTHQAGEAPRAPEPAGPILGWALACAGLLLAAGVLGLTDGRRRRRERRGVRRPRVASMIHAVLRHDAHLLRQR